MASTFNPKILMEKLAKLNSSQQSIETLSHWCIFHMHKAKQVVETWDRQFNASPREKRLAFLYLANDILQNSRRKGSEFVGEFWKFLPNALRDVINNGDELAKSAALRLINIWEERKVFGSRGQILKEEIIARRIDNKNNNNNTTNTNGKSLSGVKLKHSAGNALEKIVSGYRVIYDQLDEDSVLNKYRNAVSCVEKVDKEIVTGDIHSDQLNGSAVVDELKGQQAILRECVEQLTALESSRTNLVSNLREALHEQELKLDEIHNQLKVAQSMSEQADNIFRQLLPQDKHKPISIKDPPPPPHSTAKSSQSIISRSVEQQTSPVTYTRQVPTTEKEDPKSAAAAMAAKLTASTSSVETLSYVISSLVSEGIIGNSTKESDHADFPPEKKRLKLETNHSVPYNIPPIPPFSHEQPPPPSSPPPLPPLPPQVAYPGPTQFGNVVPYGYSTTQQQFPYQNVVAAAPFYQTEGGFYGQPSSLPMSPISRQ